MMFGPRACNASFSPSRTSTSRTGVPTLAGRLSSRLLQPVALQDRDTETDENARDLGRQRGAAGKRRAQVTAQARADLAGDQRIEHRPEQEIGRALGAALRMLEAPPADVDRLLEQLAPQRRSFGQPGTNRRVHALVHARHRDENRRADGDQILGQLLHRARVGCHRSRHHGEIVAHGALEGVRQRQERQEHVVAAHRHLLGRCMRVGEHVVVREHHALGPPGRAGGVDDRGELQRVRVHARHPDRVLRQPALGVEHPLVARAACGPSHEQHAHQSAELVAHRRERLPLLERLEQQHLGPAVLDDVGDVVRPVLRVQRHHHRTQAHRRLIVGDPRGAVAQHHRHPVAGRDAVALQRMLPARNLALHFGPGIVAPRRFGLVVFAIGDAARRSAHPLGEQPIERFRLRGRDDVELACTFSHVPLLLRLPIGAFLPAAAAAVLASIPPSSRARMRA
jgi:hypothetical protein